MGFPAVYITLPTVMGCVEIGGDQSFPAPPLNGIARGLTVIFDLHFCFTVNGCLFLTEAVNSKEEFGFKIRRVGEEITQKR